MLDIVAPQLYQVQSRKRDSTSITTRRRMPMPGKNRQGERNVDRMDEQGSTALSAGRNSCETGLERRACTKVGPEFEKQAAPDKQNWNGDEETR